MHEPFDPQCGYCVKFVYCFPASSPLADWGYCQDEVGGSPPEDGELKALEEAAARGDYSALLAASCRLYQVGDDGCARYVPRSPLEGHVH